MVAHEAGGEGARRLLDLVRRIVGRLEGQGSRRKPPLDRLSGHLRRDIGLDP